MNKEALLKLLEAGGLFSQKLPDFEEREGQIAMLRDVLLAYEQNEIALIEAGTGIGKSLAYLIPALYWALEEGEPTVIATHTIALQEQLIQKDIPFLLSTLDLELKVVLVKGMHNYVCLRKLRDGSVQLPESLMRWADTTNEGSRSSLPIYPTQDLWDQVSAETEGCTHVKCPHYRECFFFKARKQAADAHLIIANHHLLFADLTLRHQNDNYNNVCVLPPYKRLILDEAHHIEDVATEHFADKVSRRAMVHVLGTLLSDRGGGKLGMLHKKCFEAYPETGGDTEILSLLELTLPAEKRNLLDHIQQAFDCIDQFAAEHQKSEKLRLHASHLNHCSWIQTIQPAVDALVDRGKHFIQLVEVLGKKAKKDPHLLSQCEGILADISGSLQRLENLFSALNHFIFKPLDTNRVRWIERLGQLVIADLEIAPRLKEALFDKLPTTVLCSATLSTNRRFDFIRSRLGIEKAKEYLYESPFEYATQALLSVPSDMPDPSSATFIEHAAKSIFQIVEANRGGVFVLFTSYHMLKSCKALVSEPLFNKQYTLFCQGDEARSTLLKKFRKTQQAVLFGTDSFWEGVDVPGQALRCVILVKLPFKVPSDPLFQARCEAIAQKGGSPFFEYSLPHAIVKFKQGFGRLIRSKTDQGSVICLDTRLINKGYGVQFIKSLPPCPTSFSDQKKMLAQIIAKN